MHAHTILCIATLLCLSCPGAAAAPTLFGGGPAGRPDAGAGPGLTQAYGDIGGDTEFREGLSGQKQVFAGAGGAARDVELTVFDPRGRRLRTLVSGRPTRRMSVVR